MKKGSTLIESIMSISLLLVALTITLQISYLSYKSIKLRKDKEEANRIGYAIENEIKYNTSFSEIKDKFKNNNLSLEYKNNILDELLDKSLLSIEKGDDIVIEKIKDYSKEEKYEVSAFKVTIYNSSGGILNEREFIKSYWMEI